MFEYGPWFLAAWLGLAVTTGLITAAQGRGIDHKAPTNSPFGLKHLRWLWQFLFFWLWRPGGKVPALSAFGGAFLFSLAVSVPALAVTSLIGIKMVWLRLILAALYAFSLSWFVTSVISRKPRNSGEQRPGVEAASPSWVLNGETSASPLGRLRSLAQVTWGSFIGQVEGAVIPLIIGLSLASVLTIYVPTYTVRPWLGGDAWQGPYLAALLAIPLQLTGGAEVLLASALLVKGVSLGTALSIMLVAPITTFSVIRHLCRPVTVKSVALYLAATWLIAGSLGAAVDGIQRLFSVL